jgi:hypothetical protein
VITITWRFALHFCARLGHKPQKNLKIFEIRVVGGEDQLGPLGTAATNRPIVPNPSDYDDG